MSIMENKVKISTQNLNLYYGENHALKNINLDLYENKITAFIGPSGCGKSTFLRCINRLEEIDTGVLKLNGVSYEKEKKNISKVREKIGMVFQSYDLFPNMTILNNLLLAPLKVQKRNKEEVKKEAEQLLDRVGLLDKKDNYPRQLSGGQKQRISIARVFLKNPPILILDEATSSIDTRTERLIEKGMDAIMDGRTVFVIAHRLSTVRNSNAIIVLEHGGIVERGSHDELLAQKGEYYQLYNGMFELA